MKRWRRTLVLSKGSLELISSQSTDISVVRKEFLSPHLCNVRNFAFQKQQKMHTVIQNICKEWFLLQEEHISGTSQAGMKVTCNPKTEGKFTFRLAKGGFHFKETRPITFSVCSTQYVSKYIPFHIFDEISALLKFLTRKALPHCGPWKDWKRAAVNSFRCCNRTLTESDTTALQSLPFLPLTSLTLQSMP